MDTLIGVLGCVVCDSEDICCSYATHDDGSHDDPYCKRHCGPHRPMRGDDRYLRMDCDS